MSAERHARAKAIFLHARELADGERDSYLRDASDGDAELELLVRGMLAHDAPETLIPRSDAETTVLAEDDTTALPEGVVVPWRRVAGGVLGTNRALLGAGVVVVIVLVAVGLWKRAEVQARVEEAIVSLLDTVLEADIKALEFWAQTEKQIVQQWATDPDVVELVHELLDDMDADLGTIDPEQLSEQLAENEHQRALAELLRQLEGQHGHRGFALVDTNGWILASSIPATDGKRVIGTRSGAEGMRLLERTASGEVVVKMAFLTERGAAAGVVNEPLMLALSPVTRDETVVATLAFSLHPERQFSEILNLARPGETGETYAFDRDGVMISRSRYMDQLHAAGLVKADLGPDDTPYLMLRVPPDGIHPGDVPLHERRKWPLTEMARQGIDKIDDSNVAGYRDYRGVEVVGSWRWLEGYGVGVATEVDKVEAFRAADDVTGAFELVFVLLVAALLLVLGAAFLVNMMRRRLTRLGQYVLGEKLGEGGMGAVFRASHDLLQRPAAIKLLKLSKMSKENKGRFEREVQLTSQLTHPNTIEVYDFGHTASEIFYYVMEYLPGIHLGKLVKQYGPLPPARAIHVLRQMCGSLAEAHARGLVHRDVKPANVMICERGQRWDVVKVLDFGLVKQVGVVDEFTKPGMIGGTPLYIAPETLRDAKRIDGRSDLYAVGCVAFYLLTGEPVFRGSAWPELLARILSEPAPRPSARASGSIPGELDQLVVDLLAKEPEQRPQSASEVVDRLGVLARSHPWTQAEARAWWEEHVGAGVTSAD